MFVSLLSPKIVEKNWAVFKSNLLHFDSVKFKKSGNTVKMLIFA